MGRKKGFEMDDIRKKLIGTSQRPRSHFFLEAVSKLEGLETKVVILEAQAATVDELKTKVGLPEEDLDHMEQYTPKADLILSGDDLTVLAGGTHETAKQSLPSAQLATTEKLV